MRAAVEVQGQREPFGMRLVAPFQHRGVVAADLDVARPEGRGAVELVQHERLDGVHAVVGRERLRKDAELVPGARGDGEEAL